MSQPNTLLALKRKHAQLTSELKAFEAKIERIRAEHSLLDQLEARTREVAAGLGHVEESIRMFEKDWTPAPPTLASLRSRRSR
jgi:hypothetical protein